MQIGRRDIYWNYAATFLKIASAVLLLPFILRMMPTEMVGIWSVFMTITTFSALLDFGFNPSFARNVTYVFSGVKKLKSIGYETVTKENPEIDYGLLKGLISAMRWFYLRIAFVLFILLSTLGTYYIHNLLGKYNGNQQEVYIAWSLLCIINTYNLFTLYYDSLLQGKGLIKVSKQIIILGNIIYLIIATILILAGKGLISIVSAQASSVIVVRWLSYRTFFTEDINQKLENVIPRSKNEVLKAIYPNAMKIGLTAFGGFMIQKSALVIGSLYLSLKEIASYGITMQLISVIGSLAGIYIGTFQPKISQLRITENKSAIKELYIKGQIVLVLTFILGGAILLLIGEWGINYIGSQTKLIPFTILVIALFVSFLETNLGVAGSILITKNEVPFFKASLISGLSIIILLLLGFKFTNLGLYCLVLVPLIVDLSFQAWKWPYEVIRELEINFQDYISICKFNLFT